MAHDRPAITLSPTLVDAIGGAALLNISVAHFRKLARDGWIGPEAVHLGKCVRWSQAALVKWATVGCPSRSQWTAIKHDRRWPWTV